MSPRKYDSTRRREAASQTRSRILDAARALIGGKGDLDSFSMETVAEKAGVARMTVYHQFGSRAGLLDALADHLASRGGMERLREAFLEPDPESAVRKFVETFVRFWASDRVTMRRLRAMAVAFPSQDRGPRDRDAWRREGAAHLLRQLAPMLRSTGKVSLPELSELLAALTAFETFDALSSEGRSPEATARLIAEAAVRLLELPHRTAAPGRIVSETVLEGGRAGSRRGSPSRNGTEGLKGGIRH